MSNPKAKHLRALATLSEGDRIATINYSSPLHSRAHDFITIVHNGLALKRDRTVPRKLSKWKAFHYKMAIAAFEKRFLADYAKGDGSFFRAIGDVLEGAHLAGWSEQDRFFDAQCRIAQHEGKALPMPSELKRAWKIYCKIESAAEMNEGDIKRRCARLGWRLPTKARKQKKRSLLRRLTK